MAWSGLAPFRQAEQDTHLSPWRQIRHGDVVKTFEAGRSSVDFDDNLETGSATTGDTRCHAGMRGYTLSAI